MPKVAFLSPSTDHNKDRDPVVKLCQRLEEGVELSENVDGGKKPTSEVGCGRDDGRELIERNPGMSTTGLWQGQRSKISLEERSR